MIRGTLCNSHKTEVIKVGVSNTYYCWLFLMWLNFSDGQNQGKAGEQPPSSIVTQPLTSCKGLLEVTLTCWLAINSVSFVRNT